MPVVHLKNLLKSGAKGGLEEIVQRAQDMQDLTDVLRSVLPEALGDNLISASLRDNGEMVLICRTSAWASRIRFESGDLLATATRHGYAADSCRVTVSHPGP